MISPSERLAFVKDGDRWTRARLAREVDRLAAGLKAMGVGIGDRVALHLRNGPEIAVAYFACFRIGAIAAPLNLRFKTAELDDMLRRILPSVYIGHAELYRLVAPIETAVLGAASRYVVGEPEDGMAQSWTALHRDPAGMVFEEPDPNALALLLSTSGTTGKPKLVTHSHATMICKATMFVNGEIQEGDINAFFLPMVHGSGITFLLSDLLAGASLVMLDANDPDGILDAVETHRCTHVISTPTGFAHLMECQRRRPRDVSPLRICLTGGDVCPSSLQEVFPYHFGLPLRTFWASTEGGSSFTYGLQPGPVSRPLAGVEIRLVDAEDRPVPRGESGEMMLRGPHIALGYWNGPGKLERFPDGWYRTGDLMREDEDGNFWFVARAKDLIVRGGSNISPVEVEQILADHPDVRDAGVVGVPDPVLGQRVVGFVQLAEGVDADRLEDILRRASARLADYKMPERLIAVTSIPRNGLGKIDRTELARMA
ncbi:MAG TPA: class I adenylate-forming enzyme family protein [Acetobacteraceae bacterium]|nr:class I adenylate-forming enzyme family protein [Acetobacteraceae bacterium]